MSSYIDDYVFYDSEIPSRDVAISLSESNKYMIVMAKDNDKKHALSSLVSSKFLYNARRRLFLWNIDSYGKAKTFTEFKNNFIKTKGLVHRDDEL